MQMNRRTRALALALAVEASCGLLPANLEDAVKTRADIKTALGVDSKVSAHTAKRDGRTRLFVQVNLLSPVPGDAARVREDVTRIVERDFRTHVDEITINSWQ
jgi:hypothetical protein